MRLVMSHTKPLDGMKNKMSLYVPIQISGSESWMLIKAGKKLQAEEMKYLEEVRTK